MALKSSNKVEANRYELEIEVDSKTFEDAVNKSFKKESNRITIPGFRKGKAPRAFVEKYYGKEVFYEGAINDIYPDALEDAVKEAGLSIIDDKIDLDIVKADETGLVFKSCITVKPEVKIDGYKGLKVKVNPIEVTEKDIDGEIERVRERNARIIKVENRVAQKGDITEINFEGFCDGVAFDGGKAENYELELGKGRFIEGFEEQVEGHNTGDEFDVNVRFPKDYQSKDLADKEAVFKVKINEIKEKQLPEIDNEFVKDVSEFDNITEYREDLKKKLTQQAEKKSKTETEENLAGQLIELIDAEIPEAMFKNKIKEMVNEFGYRLQSQGLDLKSYIHYMKLDEEKFNETFRPKAENEVKLRLALEKIAVIENIAITKEDIDEEYSNLAKAYNMEADKVKNIIPEEDIKKDLSVKKAMEFVCHSAVIEH